MAGSRPNLHTHHDTIVPGRACIQGVLKVEVKGHVIPTHLEFHKNRFLQANGCFLSDPDQTQCFPNSPFPLSIRFSSTSQFPNHEIWLWVCTVSWWNSLSNGLAFCLYVSSLYYQRVSIASYANRWYSQRRNVRLSVTLRYCIKTKKASVMISSPSERQNILVSRNIWFITKFDRGHPERRRFLRLGWVGLRTGDFGDFSTNKPPYLRNGAR